ncbi:hypothetical protein KM043_013954 [Ampulex compressa]|nr:hypothetical protein KM043_013954 [Ampulex compressa]
MACESNILTEKELIRKRSSIKSKFTRFIDYVQGFDPSEDSSINELQMRLQWAERDFEVFETIQSALETIATDDICEQCFTERGEIEEAYYHYTGKAETLLKTMTYSTQQQLNNVKNSPKKGELPVLQTRLSNKSLESWEAELLGQKRKVKRLNPQSNLACKTTGKTKKISDKPAKKEAEKKENVAQNDQTKMLIIKPKYEDLVDIIAEQNKKIAELSQIIHEMSGAKTKTTKEKKSTRGNQNVWENANRFAALSVDETLPSSGQEKMDADFPALAKKRIIQGSDNPTPKKRNAPPKPSTSWANQQENDSSKSDDDTNIHRANKDRKRMKTDFDTSKNQIPDR